MKIGSFKKIPQGVKASIAFFIASVITSGIAYITTPIYTRLLTTDEYGQVSIFLSWLQIFGIIAMFCLHFGVFNNGMLDYPNHRDDYSFSMLILSNIITLSFSGILLCVYPIIKNFLKLDIAFVILMCVIFLFQPAYNFWCTRQRYELKYKAILFWSILSAILSPSVAIALILTNKSGSNLYPRLFGAESVLILMYLGFYFYLGFKNKWKLNVKYWKQALLFNLPLIPHYLSTYILNSSDKIMISNLIDDTAAAYYSVAHSIAAIASIIWVAINSSLIPFTYEKCKENKYGEINKVTLPLISIFAAGCVGVIMLAPEAVKIMATSDYKEAIYVIPPIVGGVFFQVQYYLYANILFYHKKPKYVMIGSISAMSLNLFLNYFCIKKWGYVAAGYTTIACYGFQAIIDYIAMKKVVKKSVYNMKYMIILSLLVTVIALTSSLIYDYTKIRLTILVELIIAAIIFRKDIIKALRFKNNNEKKE